MQSITIKINLGNSAFHDIGPVGEIVRLFNVIARDLQNDGEVRSRYQDINGNTVCYVSAK